MNLIENLKTSPKPVVGGHRGQLLTGIRENTLPAFETLLGKGILYIEVDVQLTKDGRLVLFHDYDLSRQTKLTGMARDYSLLELEAAADICTVEAAIAWAKTHQLGLAFELKIHHRPMFSDRLTIAEQLVSCLQEQAFQSQCFVFGSDYGLLRHIKGRDNRISIGLIVPFLPEDPVQLMADLSADIYLNYADKLPLELIKKLQAAGYLVDGSIVNTRDQLALALSLGLDMIESDYPELMLTELEELR